MQQADAITPARFRKESLNHLRAMLSKAGLFARKKPLAAAGFGIVLLTIVLTIAAPIVTIHEPNEIRPDLIMISPNSTFWFGTDIFGRDVFSRTIHGAKISLYVGIVTMVLAAGSGLVIGVTSGYFGGKIDLTVQRFIDAISAIPSLVLALALVTIMPPSINSIVLALTIVQLPRMTRVIRSSVLSIKEMPYIDAATAIGGGHLRIMFRHIAPNTYAPLIIVATSAIGAVIITEATLSFLGIGMPVGTIGWGSMLGGDTKNFFAGAPWMAMAPGFAISLVVFGLNMFGDGLRDVMDPKLRGR